MSSLSNFSGWYVDKMQDAPRLNYKLKTVHDDFGIYYDTDLYDLKDPYLQHLVIFPLICAVIVFVVLVIFQIYLFCRSGRYVRSCRCTPNQPKSAGRCQYIAAAVLIVGTLVVNQSIISGVLDMNSGVSDVDDQLVFIKNTATSINNNAIDLEDQGVLLEATFAALSATVCGESCNCSDDFLLAVTNTYLPPVKSYEEWSDDLPDKVQDVRNFLDDGTHYSRIIFWGMYVIMTGLLLFITIGACKRSSFVLKIASLTSCWYMTLVSVFCTFLFVVLIGYSDFCQDPQEYTLQLIEPIDRMYSDVDYYTTCQGIAPYGASLTSARASVDTLSSLINTTRATYSTCTNSTVLDNADSRIASINILLDSSDSLSSCPPLYDAYYSIMDAGCGDVFSGIFKSWLGQSIAALLLLVICIRCSILYQYFTVYRGIEEDEEEEEEEEDDESSSEDSEIESPTGVSDSHDSFMAVDAEPYYEPESFPSAPLPNRGRSYDVRSPEIVTATYEYDPQRAKSLRNILSKAVVSQEGDKHGLI